MANIPRLARYITVLKSKVAADFSLGTVITDGWASEGSGPTLNLITRTADTQQSNVPIAGLNVITEHRTITPFLDIYIAYLAGLAAPQLFVRSSLRFTATEMQITLNLEE